MPGGAEIAIFLYCPFIIIIIIIIILVY